jgi:hypothetical protein
LCLQIVSWSNLSAEHHGLVLKTEQFVASVAEPNSLLRPMKEQRFKSKHAKAKK